MRRFFAVLLIFAATGASGGSSSEEDWCRNGLFPTEPPFALAKVEGRERLYFLEDYDGCPDRGAACRQRTYVTPGDRVLTNRKHGPYTCAFFPNRLGGSAGWVETSRLRAIAVAPNPPLSAWTGKWSDEGHSELRIRLRGNGLQVSGMAYWPGRPGTHDYPSVHVGELGGNLVVTGNRARYSNGDGQYDCRAEFSLLGNLLVVGDNLECGGANVSFSAVYERAGR